MEFEPSKNDYNAISKLAPATILADWLLAIDSFQAYYNQLGPYATQPGAKGEASNSQSLDRGQCPLVRLRILLNQMQQELENLWLDLELLQLTGQADSEQKYQKLARHTHRLNQFNQQARVMLLLIAQSAV